MELILILRGRVFTQRVLSRRSVGQRVHRIVMGMRKTWSSMNPIILVSYLGIRRGLHFVGRVLPLGRYRRRELRIAMLEP